MSIMWKIILLVIMCYFCTVMSANCVTVSDPTQGQKNNLIKNKESITCMREHFWQTVRDYEAFYSNITKSQGDKIMEEVRELIKDKEIYNKYHRSCKTEIVETYLKKTQDAIKQFGDCKLPFAEYVDSVDPYTESCVDGKNTLYVDMESKKWGLFFKLNYYLLKLKYCSIRYLTKFSLFHPFLSVVHRTRKCILVKAGKKLRFT